MGPTFKFSNLLKRKDKFTFTGHRLLFYLHGVVGVRIMSTPCLLTCMTGGLLGSGVYLGSPPFTVWTINSPSGTL